MAYYPRLLLGWPGIIRLIHKTPALGADWNGVVIVGVDVVMSITGANSIWHQEAHTVNVSRSFFYRTLIERRAGIPFLVDFIW
jgi:hypothetical protein